MTSNMHEHDREPSWTRRAQAAGVALRRSVLAAAAVAFVVLIGAVGLIVAVSAFAVAAVLGLTVALVWLVSKALRGGERARRDGPAVLDARRGPQGWTVDLRGDVGAN